MPYHGYSAGGTIRTGRTVQISDQRGGAVASFCFLFLLCLFLVAVPCLLVAAEVEFRDRVLAFKEVSSAGIMECTDTQDQEARDLNGLKRCVDHGGPVHLSSDRVKATVQDDAFGVRLTGALQVKVYEGQSSTPC
jgi:hypothetical protein